MTFINAKGQPELDPQVQAVQMHPGGGPVPDSPSTGAVGKHDGRQLDITADGAPMVGIREVRPVRDAFES